MAAIVYFICIFTCIFFIYLHVSIALKTEHYLELFEGTYESRKQLSTMCSVRQPVIFAAPTPWRHLFPLLANDRLSAGCVDDVKIKSSQDSRATTCLLYPAAEILLTQTKGKYFSDGNSVLHVAGAARALRSMGEDLQPFGSFKGEWDTWLGSAHTETPLRLHQQHRMYLIPVTGSVKVRLCTFNSRAYFAEEVDYSNLEFRGAHNPWDAASKTSHPRLRFKECVIIPGEILFIPPRVWYSVQYSDTPGLMHQINVVTFTNPATILANLPYLFCRARLQFLKQKTIQLLESDLDVDCSHVNKVVQEVQEVEENTTPPTVKENMDTDNVEPELIILE